MVEIFILNELDYFITGNDEISNICSPKTVDNLHETVRLRFNIVHAGAILNIFLKTV